MLKGIKSFVAERVSFSAKTWPEKITTAAVIIGEVAIGVILVYAVLTLPL